MRTGRPKKEINQLQFEHLCALQCPEEEIAYHFDCSVDTLQRWCKRTYGTTFAEAYKKHSVDGLITIRAEQFKLAKKGNSTMLIWLGKQLLGQADDKAARADGGGEVVNIEWD